MADGLSSRFLYQLIISQLENDGYAGAAKSVSEYTSTPSRLDIPRGRLASLLAAALADKSSDPITGGAIKYDSDEEQPDDKVENEKAQEDVWMNYGSKEQGLENYEAEASAEKVPKSFPACVVRYTAMHKNTVRAAKFSLDGRLAATASADTSIKLLDVYKMLRVTTNSSGGGGGGGQEARPVIKNFYDHTMPISDMDFHPTAPILISAAKDSTIKFFDTCGTNALRRAVRYLQDTHNVRSVHFHPSGDFLLAGTDHHMIRLYDVNTFQCYTTPAPDSHHQAPINMVRYAADANVYASCSKDGSIRIWDTVSNNCVTAIQNAHSGFEVSSIQFTKGGRYLLSCGKDSLGKLWDVSTGKTVCIYSGAVQSRYRSQWSFAFHEDFVMGSDESKNDVCIWDTRKGDIVFRLSSGHSTVRVITFSPVDPFFFTCSDDGRAKFWTMGSLSGANA